MNVSAVNIAMRVFVRYLINPFSGMNDTAWKCRGLN